jgi:hypothetical protein
MVDKDWRKAGSGDGVAGVGAGGSVAVPVRSGDNWLASFRDELKRDITAICRIDAKKVVLDIAARKADVKLARQYVGWRLRLVEELDKFGMSEEAWCQSLGRGQSLSQMRRRIQLARPGCFQHYLNRRRALDDDGRFGLEYAIELSQHDSASESVTSTHPETRVACADETSTKRHSQRETELAARVAELEIALRQAGSRNHRPRNATGSLRQNCTPPCMRNMASILTRSPFRPATSTPLRYRGGA